MDDEKEIELIPQQKTASREFFESPEAYDEFCRRFVDQVKPDLKKQREARQQSEADVKQRWMH